MTGPCPSNHPGGHNRIYRRRALAVLAGAGFLVLRAQMVDPALDRPDEPFCYFSQPTDVIGVLDGREGTLVTPEGYFYCGAGELMFFSEDPPRALQQRVKTLYKGYLPVVEYALERDGIGYAFSGLAVTLDGTPGSPLVNLIRVRITNRTTTPRLVRFATALRYQNEANTDWGVGDNRFGRPVAARKPGEFEQAGVPFDLQAVYAFHGNTLRRNDSVLYTFPEAHLADKILTLKMGYNEEPFRDPMTLYVLPTTPVGVVKYVLPLAPGKTRELEYKLPYLPLDPAPANLAALERLNHAAALVQTEVFWEDILSRGLEIRVPEPKVNETFQASLIYTLIARDLIDGHYVQKVNEFQYDSFWLRDAAFIVHMYDLSGYHRFARECLEFFPFWQQEDGNFLSQGGQVDGWGQALWAFGRHLRLTGDGDFIRGHWPRLRKAFDWLRKTRAEDPLQLLPVTTPGDNELITGRVTGHNIWALIGLKLLITMAEALGAESDAREFRREYADYYRTFHEHLTAITDTTGGVIPPGLDTSGGQDWGNLLSLYPEPLFSRTDPRVAATLDRAREQYQEGLMTYGDGRYLHHYLTLRNAETALILGRQEQVIQDLYAVLLHTSATHAGFEFSIRPWGDRDFGMNLAPHGWFAAELRILLRNLLVREENNDLHLLSAVSPEWIRRGQRLSVRRAPTEFGSLDLELTTLRNGAEIELRSRFHRLPDNLILHFPWFLSVRSVEADGRRLNFDRTGVVLPPDARSISIRWRDARPRPTYSYTRTVTEYKTEYARRYAAYRHGTGTRAGEEH